MNDTKIDASTEVCNYCGANTCLVRRRPPTCRVCLFEQWYERDVLELASVTDGDDDSYTFLHISHLAGAFVSLRHGENDADGYRPDILTAVERIIRRRNSAATAADILAVLHDGERCGRILWLEFVEWLAGAAAAERMGEARTPARGLPLTEDILVRGHSDPTERISTAKALRALRLIASPAQRRALRRQWRGTVLDSADRNALYHLRRRPDVRRLAI